MPFARVGHGRCGQTTTRDGPQGPLDQSPVRLGPPKGAKLQIKTIEPGSAIRVDPKYKESATEMVVAVKKLKEAYDTLLKTDEKAADKIKDTIYKKAIAYISQLGQTAKEAPKIENKEDGFSLKYCS